MIDAATDVKILQNMSERNRFHPLFSQEDAADRQKARNPSGRAPPGQSDDGLRKLPV